MRLIDAVIKFRDETGASLEQAIQAVRRAEFESQLETGRKRPRRRKMANQDQLFTDGVIPVPLDDVDPWDGDVSYELGRNTFRVDGYKLVEGSKAIQMQHTIMDGPERNKGRKYNMFFHVATKPGKQRLKDFCLKLAGKDGLLKGQAYVKALVGTVYTADFSSRVVKSKKSGGMITVYEVLQSTINVTQRPAVVTPTADVNPA